VKLEKNKSFFILWLGIGVSILGSELTEFAIGLWMLKDSMSVTSYTFLDECLIYI